MAPVRFTARPDHLEPLGASLGVQPGGQNGDNLSRKPFAATCFLATMKAIGRESVNLSDV
jgi:hypothetical protein